MNTETAELVEKLRQASRGSDEWRVQDEKGSYWIAFAHGDGYTLDPEREAREWLADQQKNNPGHAKARGTVACVQVQTQAQELMQEAAAEIERLRDELALCCELKREYQEQAAAAHAAALDCRTCRQHNDRVGGCMSVVRCVDGSAYQRAGVRQCWASGA